MPLVNAQVPPVESVNPRTTYPAFHQALAANAWSTDKPLPMLPHVSSGISDFDLCAVRTGVFEVPRVWDFKPVLEGWMTGM